MSRLRREAREVYRLYDGEEFLSSEQPLGPAAEAGGADGPAEEQALPATPSEDPLKGRRRVITPAMILAAGLGAIVVAAVEMHASVGRLPRPAEARREVPPRSNGTPRRRSARLRSTGSKRIVRARRAIGSREAKDRPLRPGRRALGVPDRAAPGAAWSPPSPAQEFGFEQ